jgi:hypothetical protein
MNNFVSRDNLLRKFIMKNARTGFYFLLKMFDVNVK